MAKHKAPTQVTIADVDEKSAFAALLERIWIPLALAAAVIVGIILYGQSAKEKQQKLEADSWDQLAAAASLSFANPQWTPDPDAFTSPGESVAAPWTLYSKAIAFGQEREFDQAAEALRQLQQEFPQHELNTRKFAFGEDGAESTLPERMSEVFQLRGAWDADNPQLYGNPELPAGSPRVRITTGEGDILVGLYADRAPLHTENFLKLCRENFYDGTRFHRVLNGRIIQGGDPDSKNDDTLAWGKGGPGYKIDKEDTGLMHFEGVLAAAKMGGDEESSGSQFYITLQPEHGFDDRYVVYGTVLEGLDNAKTIGDGELSLNSDRPVEPIKIISTEVLDG